MRVSPPLDARSEEWQERTNHVSLMGKWVIRMRPPSLILRIPILVREAEYV